MTCLRRQMMWFGKHCLLGLNFWRSFFYYRNREFSIWVLGAKLHRQQALLSGSLLRFPAAWLSSGVWFYLSRRKYRRIMSAIKRILFFFIYAGFSALRF